MEPSKQDWKEQKVANVFTNYVNAMKANDIDKMKSYIKVLSESGNENIDEHLKGLNQQPIPEVGAYGNHMIAETLAIVETENKLPNHSYSQNLAVYKDNDQWKIIFGQPLTNSFILKSSKSVDIK